MDIQPPRKDKKVINLIGTLILVLITGGIVGYNYFRIDDQLLVIRDARLKLAVSLKLAQNEIPASLRDLYLAPMRKFNKKAFENEITNAIKRIDHKSPDGFMRFLRVSEDHLNLTRQILILERKYFAEAIPNPTKENLDKFYKDHPIFKCISLNHHVFSNIMGKYLSSSLLDSYKKYIFEGKSRLSRLAKDIQNEPDKDSIALFKKFLDKFRNFLKVSVKDYQDPNIIHTNYAEKNTFINDTNQQIQRTEALINELK